MKTSTFVALFGVVLIATGTGCAAKSIRPQNRLPRC